MNVIRCFTVLLIGTAAAFGGDWQILFDGSSLDGWKASEVPGVFTIADGVLKADGGRSHLFWMGTESIPGSFTNFEFNATVKTTPGSNSGIFFHTQYQETNWPAHGYEAQVNSTHKDPRRTGSIYAVRDILKVSPSTDDVWFDYRIRVEGSTITISIDNKVVNTYTEPADLVPDERRPHRRLGSGTIAIQGHDPKSIVYYKNIRIRALE